MQNTASADKIDDFIKICQEHNLKITPQRVAIYRELIDSKIHPSADTIYQIVQTQYPNISFDTVNRTLLTLAKIGLAEVIEVFGGAKRFDPNVTNHHHLHCTQCGKIVDFWSRLYDKLEIPENVQKQFEVIDKRVVLKGICKDCQN